MQIKDIKARETRLTLCTYSSSWKVMCIPRRNKVAAGDLIWMPIPRELLVISILLGASMALVVVKAFPTEFIDVIQGL